jgi:hypothetical protein
VTLLSSIRVNLRSGDRYPIFIPTTTTAAMTEAGSNASVVPENRRHQSMFKSLNYKGYQALHYYAAFNGGTTQYIEENVSRFSKTSFYNYCDKAQVCCSKHSTHLHKLLVYIGYS